MVTKVFKYNYTSNISFIGLMSKSQFVLDVSDLTCDNKNAIKDRVIVTDNVNEIETARKKIGVTIKIVK